MKVLDDLWGIAITTIMYAILTTLCYQVIYEGNLEFAYFFGFLTTLIFRWILAKALQGVEVDFDLIRELFTLVILLLITRYHYA